MCAAFPLGGASLVVVVFSYLFFMFMVIPLGVSLSPGVGQGFYSSGVGD